MEQETPRGIDPHAAVRSILDQKYRQHDERVRSGAVRREEDSVGRNGNHRQTSKDDQGFTEPGA
jgi:hypothetical protein